LLVLGGAIPLAAGIGADQCGCGDGKEYVARRPRVSPQGYGELQQALGNLLRRCRPLHLRELLLDLVEDCRCQRTADIDQGFSPGGLPS